MTVNKHFVNKNLDYSILDTYDLPINQQANEQYESTLTAAQLNSLSILKERLQADFPKHVHNTASLIRFMKARKFDVDKSEYMYRERMQWVNDYQPHRIKQHEVVDQLKLGAFFWHSNDAYGRPVLIFKAKNFFPIKNDPNNEKLWRYFVYVVEYGLRKLPLPPYDQVVVLNCRQGATSSNNDLGGFRRLVKVGDYYPEVMGTFITVYPNQLFKVIMMVIKPFLDPTTQKKIQMIKHNNPSMISSELVSKHGFHQDDVSKLLVEHGGSKTIEHANTTLEEKDEAETIKVK
jgi:hypothetical protein